MTTPAPGAAGAPLTILVVEDHPTVAQSICEILELEGYRCIVASSFADGRAKLQAGGIDILLTDHHLGDGHGVDLLAGLDGQTPPITVLMSALLDRSVEERARLLGFRASVDKAAFTPDLLRTLHKAASESREP